MPRNLLSLLIFAALTLLVVVLWESPPSQLLRDPAGDQSEAADHPDIYMSGVEVMQYDERGAMDYHFRAERMDHFQLDPRRPGPKDYTEIDAPHIILYRRQTVPRFIQSNRGHADASGEIITLIDDVRVWQTQNDQLISELTTTKLVVKPDEQYAETDKPVMIDAGINNVKAVGMKAFFDQDRIELLSQVRSLHDTE